MSQVLLSVCVPIFNRTFYLQRLLNSIDLCYVNQLEIVLVDDGSTENVYSVLEEYCNNVSLSYKYVRQINSGVSKAMKVAYEHSSGLYCIKMDSDDYFTSNGLAIIFERILSLVPGSYDICGFAFGVQQIWNRAVVDNVPPDIKTNFLSLRADYSVSGDLKEVVLRSVILENMYDVPEGVRRVPPSLLWARISLTYDCLFVAKVVACKEYLNNGITSNIFVLKFNGSVQMQELYYIQQLSRRYNSRIYRIMSRVLFARYSFHSNRIVFNDWWVLIYYPVGAILFLIDRIRLCLLSHYKN